MPTNNPSRTFRHALTTIAALALAATVARSAHAEARTWNYLTTGNGHGFQVFDANQHKVVQFLEHPYRYISPGSDPQGEGVGRRNLAYDVYFGLRGGGGSGWLNAPDSSDDPEYLEQTNIIRVPQQTKGVAAESYFFSPFGLEKNAMVALLHAPGASQGFALMNFHMGTGRPDPGATGESSRMSGAAVVETGPGGGAMIYVPISAFDKADCQGPYGKVQGNADLGTTAACTGNDVALGFQHALGADGWMGLVAAYVDDSAQADATVAAITAWVAGRAPDRVLTDAKAEWDAWRKPPSPEVALCSDAEKKIWRQSETVLRMGQVREANSATRHSNGMLLASLPPGEWHSGWVRDATYGVVALARMGHHAEAKAALDFFLNAQPVGKYKSYVSGADYRISVVRYFGTGEEEADYSGQPSPNVETDGWGLVLWAARQYVDASGDTAWLNTPTRSGTVYQALERGVAHALEQNMEPSLGIMKADSSIWEVHDANKRHYAYTSLTAARGFCDMAAMAKKNGNNADHDIYKADATRVKSATLATFIDDQGSLIGSLEGKNQGKYFDGAVAEAFTWNVIDDYKGKTAKATLDMLSKLRVASGGFKRNDDGLSVYDNNEWILVDLRIANAMRRSGDTAGSDGVVATIVTKAAANFNLLPELYNAVATDGQIGKYTGSIPMVGYGGGAYVITMLDRSGISEPNDCGDGMSAALPKLDCGGVTVTPGTGIGADGGTTGGGGNGAAPSAAELPFVGACLCEYHPGSVPRQIMLAACMFFPTAFAVRRVRRRRASAFKK